MIILRMKTCTKCGIEKELCEFHKHKFQKDGHNTICKNCRKPISKNYHSENREIIIKKQREYYRNNHEKILLRDRERIKGEREKRNKRAKEYAQKNKEKIQKYRKEYYEKNKDKLTHYSKEYTKKNKEWILLKKKEYVNKRKKEDIFFRLKTKLKTDIYISLKRKKRNKRLEVILGITIEKFKEYIESQFDTWMTWDNWGHTTWHIDHIIPLSSAKDENKLYELWHYTNMKPISATENLKKGQKIL